MVATATERELRSLLDEVETLCEDNGQNAIRVDDLAALIRDRLASEPASERDGAVEDVLDMPARALVYALETGQDEDAVEARTALRAALRSSAAGLDAGLLAQAMVDTDEDNLELLNEGETLGESFYKAALPRARAIAAEYAALAAPQAAPKTQEEAGG